MSEIDHLVEAAGSLGTGSVADLIEELQALHEQKKRAERPMILVDQKAFETMFGALCYMFDNALFAGDADTVPTMKRTAHEAVKKLKELDPEAYERVKWLR